MCFAFFLCFLFLQFCAFFRFSQKVQFFAVFAQFFFRFFMTDYIFFAFWHIILCLTKFVTFVDHFWIFDIILNVKFSNFRNWHFPHSTTEFLRIWHHFCIVHLDNFFCIFVILRICWPAWWRFPGRWWGGKWFFFLKTKVPTDPPQVFSSLNDVLVFEQSLFERTGIIKVSVSN